MTAQDPMEYVGHYLIGANPNDPEYGCWATEQEAMTNFAIQFSELAQKAQGCFLFVRLAPVCKKEPAFEGDRWRMIGRFSIAKVKEGT